MLQWLADDPRAALDWTVHMPDEESREAVCRDARFQLAVRSAAERMLERARARSEGEAGAAVENFAQVWAETDLRSVEDWIRAMPPCPQRDACVARVGFVASQKAPLEAAQFVIDEIPPGHVQEEAAISVLHQWALRDPGAAGAWVEQFPASQLRDRAVQELQGVAAYREAVNGAGRGGGP